MRSLEDFKWVSCRAGPHLLLPAELLGAWEGVKKPSFGRIVRAIFRFTMDPASPATDYDRACDVNDLLGLIPVGDGHALVLGGDEVPMSTWIAHPDGGGGDDEAPPRRVKRGLSPRQPIMRTVHAKLV